MNMPDWFLPLLAPFVTIVFIVVVYMLGGGDSDIDHWLEYDEEIRQQEKDKLRRLQIEYYERENARSKLDT